MPSEPLRCPQIVCSFSRQYPLIFFFLHYYMLIPLSLVLTFVRLGKILFTSYLDHKTKLPNKCYTLIIILCPQSFLKYNGCHTFYSGTQIWHWIAFSVPSSQLLPTTLYYHFNYLPCYISPLYVLLCFHCA